MKHLCRLVNQFENFPLLPEKLYLEALIRRLFHLTSQKQRDSLYELYSPENFPYLWRIFDVQYLSANIQHLVKNSISEIGINHTNKFLSKDEYGKLDFVRMVSC